MASRGSTALDLVGQSNLANKAWPRTGSNLMLINIYYIDNIVESKNDHCIVESSHTRSLKRDLILFGIEHSNQIHVFSPLIVESRNNTSRNLIRPH